MRLFVAIDLSASIRKSLSEQIRDLESILDTRTIRWVKPSAMHLTLKFLGETPDHKVEQIQSTLAEIAPQYSPFTIQIGTFGCFPNLRKPRVLWVGIHEQTGSLKKLHRELEMEFRKLGFKAENRPFQAHLTLGRVKKNISSAELDILRSQLGDVKIEELGKETVEAIYLIRSFLRPTGAEYTRLGMYELTERGK